MAHFQHDRETKDLPDTGHGEEFYELLSDLELPGDHRFNPLDLVFQMSNEAHACCNGNAHLWIGKECFYLRGAQFLHLLAFHPDAEVSGEDILDAQDVGCPVADKMEPLPEKIPGGALFLWVDIARGQDV